MEILKLLFLLFCLCKLHESANCGHADFPWDNPCNGSCGGYGYCGGTYPCHCIHDGALQFLVAEQVLPQSTQPEEKTINESVIVEEENANKDSPMQAKENMNNLRNNNCCYGPIGFSCGPCIPTVPGATIGFGYCCSW